MGTACFSENLASATSSRVDTTFLKNYGMYLQVHMALMPRKPTSIQSLKAQIAYMLSVVYLTAFLKLYSIE
jgi:hypothetical protein